MVVVTWDNHDLAPSERTPKLFKERSGSRERVAPGPMAQLQDIAEQDKPIDIGKRLDESCSWLRAAQHISPGGGPEVHVRDD